MEPKTKEYVRPIPWTWWLKQPAYVKFMVRELTAVFIALYCIFLLYLMHQAHTADDAAFADLIDKLATPWAVILHLVALGFALFNTLTFIELTPRVVVVQQGEDKLTDQMIIGLHFAVFVVSSAILIGLAVWMGSNGKV